MTFDEMVKAIHEKKNFSFSRWGDGEWAAVLGLTGENCDAHIYHKSLGAALRSVLTEYPEPRYYMGLQPKAISDIGVQIQNFLDTHKISIPWLDSDIIHTANEEGRMGEFLQACNTRKTILVGPKFLFNAKLNYEMVVIPPKNCWLAFEAIKAEILKRITPNTVILYCASMASEVLIDHIHKMYGDDVTQVDVGSALDVHAGRCSRRYHERMVK